MKQMIATSSPTFWRDAIASAAIGETRTMPAATRPRRLEAFDPATGDDTHVMFVKGSGGDLGTLTASGLAALDLSRVRGLVGRYRGPEHEDEMVGLFDYCLFGRGGAAPSIDTAMHALVDEVHVDHLHPDSIIAFATSIDGPELTKRCFGDEVLWVDWRRPGFQLGLDIAELHAVEPERNRMHSGRSRAHHVGCDER